MWCLVLQRGWFAYLTINFQKPPTSDEPNREATAHKLSIVKFTSRAFQIHLWCLLTPDICWVTGLPSNTTFFLLTPSDFISRASESVIQVPTFGFLYLFDWLIDTTSWPFILSSCLGLLDWRTSSWGYNLLSFSKVIDFYFLWYFVSLWILSFVLAFLIGGLHSEDTILSSLKVIAFFLPYFKATGLLTKNLISLHFWYNWGWYSIGKPRLCTSCLYIDKSVVSKIQTLFFLEDNNLCLFLPSIYFLGQGELGSHTN